MKLAGSGAVEAGAAGIAMKLGLFKLLGGGAALLGAFLMAAVLEPKSKREMVLRAFVALGTSVLATDWLMKMVAPHFGFEVRALDPTDLVQYTLVTGGVVGALSWFALGAAGYFLEKFRSDPVSTVKAIKSLNDLK